MSTINNRIKELREEKFMTKAAFAALIGVNQQRVYEIESNKVAPSEKAIMGIIEKLGVNMDWLMRGVGEKYAKASEITTPAVSGNEIFVKLVETDISRKLDLMMAQIMKMSAEIAELKADKNNHAAA
jgi:DNA-binding XRE family transcriptional regulator